MTEAHSRWASLGSFNATPRSTSCTSLEATSAHLDQAIADKKKAQAIFAYRAMIASNCSLSSTCLSNVAVARKLAILCRGRANPKT